MGWPSTMVFVGHGESVKNAFKNNGEGRMPTHLAPLTPRGEKQAKLAREYLDAHYGKFDIYLSSYYLRAKETLRIMYPEERHFEMSMLAEVQHGIWDAMTDEEIKQAYPHEFTRRELEGWYHYRPLGGESFLDAESRAINFITIMQTYFSQKRVLMVSHENWLGMFQKVVHHLTVEESLAVLKRRHENCSITSYEANPNGKQVIFTVKENNLVPWKGKL